MTTKKYKTIYFIYNADSGLFNSLKYWYKKNIKKQHGTCELCDISHGKYFVRIDWLLFLWELKKDYDVKVLHRDEVSQKIKDKVSFFPTVIGETFDNEIVQIMNKISFVDWGNPTDVRELEEQIREFIDDNR